MPFVVYLSQRSEELRLYNLFKPSLENGIFSMQLVAERFAFGGDNRSFLREGVNPYLIASMSHLNSSSIFLSSYLYSMVKIDYHDTVLTRLLAVWSNPR
jgi:hypothetical protein